MLRGKNIDPGKITVLTTGTSLTGKALHSLLRDRFHLELEMATPTYAIAMTSPADTWEGLLRLSDALMEIDIETEKRERLNMEYYLPDPEVFMPIREAKEMADQTGTALVDIGAAEGRVSAAFAYIYPPGTPILSPGEIITRSVIEVVASCENSLIKVLGLENGKILVLRKGK